MIKSPSLMIKKVLLIGSGPIVVGQAGEFDYSGSQAIKALKELGIKVVLWNSNPATIMTDRDMADVIYMEPLQLPVLEKILVQEKPDGMLVTFGGQTALNLGLQAHKHGLCDKYQVPLLGIEPHTIEICEDREKFRSVLERLGYYHPRSYLVNNLSQASELLDLLNFPLILRPNYTLGGDGSAVVYHPDEYLVAARRALEQSPTRQVLVEESLLGWQEFELEIMCDRQSTGLIVCSIENIDPCGVHTGDSVTVAPQLTLPDVVYQRMRQMALTLARAVGLAASGANVQFAYNPSTGQIAVIEMNPRVSRSSALASKATGFPIAKIATYLALGWRLDQLPNAITQKTPASFEPALDYVAVKFPKFQFEKFSPQEDSLTTSMKSFGETLTFGRTFLEAFLKGLYAIYEHEDPLTLLPECEIEDRFLIEPNSRRYLWILKAIEQGRELNHLRQLTQIHPFFFRQWSELIQFTQTFASEPVTPDSLWQAKRFGLSDRWLARLRQVSPEDIRRWRYQWQVRPWFQPVDTCAGEFEAQTPYFYGTYHYDQEISPPENRPKTQLLGLIGSGAYRVGQGIEFDYSLVKQIQALRKQNVQVVLINSNPETVSTDYDTADILIFEPTTFEFISEAFKAFGVQEYLCQFGGQTALKVSVHLSKDEFHSKDLSLKSLELTEDRRQFAETCSQQGIPVLPYFTLTHPDQALRGLPEGWSFPVMVRPSFVIGGQGMQVIYDLKGWQDYFHQLSPEVWRYGPVFVDPFLSESLEFDVDFWVGTQEIQIIGFLEHVEWAGIHSGDSIGVTPPIRLPSEVQGQVNNVLLKVVKAFNLKGFGNLQAIWDGHNLFVLEVNARTSRSLPFLMKAYGKENIFHKHAINLKNATDASSLSLAWSERELKLQSVEPFQKSYFVKGVVFPFKRFRRSDVRIGVDMKSTGEVMGWGLSPSEAFFKAFWAMGYDLPTLPRVVLFSIADSHKKAVASWAKMFWDKGFEIWATSKTSEFLKAQGLPVRMIAKVHEGRPNVVDVILNHQVGIVVNIPSPDSRSAQDGFLIRRACVETHTPLFMRLEVLGPFLEALDASQKPLAVRPLTPVT